MAATATQSHAACGEHRCSVASGQNAEITVWDKVNLFSRPSSVES
jgi:hypothetical protein